MFRIWYRESTAEQMELYGIHIVIQNVDFVGHITRKQAMCVCVYVCGVSFVCAFNN